MQLAIWIIAISVVAGPILLGLVLHHLGFSRAVTLGIGMAILGGSAILLSREPFVDSSAQRVAAIKLSTSKDNARSATAPDAGRREAGALSALELERAAHQQTRRDLEIAKAKIASLSADQPTPANAGSDSGSEPQTIRDELKSARLRLAIANAEIERLKSAVRAAEPVATAAPLPATPQPFAYAPAVEEQANAAATATVNSSEIATGATSAASGQKEQDGDLGRILAQAMRSRRFSLVKLANDELVEGRRGSYYRITCPGTDSRPLKFGAGHFTFGSGFNALDTCVKAIENLLLEPLPANTEHRLYVQGYASFRGFVRPKALPAHEKHLKSIAYLRRLKDGTRYAPAQARQLTGRRFTNTDLPNLRAASVAHRIETLTKRAIVPEILEGELKPDGDPVSQSFAIILQMPW